MSDCESVELRKSDVTSLDIHKLETFKVYVITWNVGSRYPDNISFKSLLGLLGPTDDQHLPDIYALGCQELNSQPQQQVLGLFKEDPYTYKTRKTLREYDYVMFKSEQMQGLLLSLYIRRKHLPYLRDIEAEHTRTGFGGIWGNKGAVSVRFNLYGCALTFVVAHLAAHDHHLDERIADYKQIMENHHYHVPRFREIFDHDYVFWFGDLNFRLQGDDSPAEVLEAVKEGKCAALLQRDQLQHVRLCTKQAFHLLHERTPEFPPTFKFKEGTSEYDLKRRPAWTDRILYLVSNKQPDMPLEIEQYSYKAHPGYNISDHKPVTSEFKVKLYPNHRDPTVMFKNIPVWYIGEEYTVEYIEPAEFENIAYDWIAVYHVSFTSFHQSIAYEYIHQAETPPSSPETERDEYFEPTPSRHHHGKHHHPERCSREQQENIKTVRLKFAEDVELKHGEHYVLIYFQSNSTRGVTSIAGLSNVFMAEKRSRSPTYRRRHSHSD